MNLRLYLPLIWRSIQNTYIYIYIYIGCRQFGRHLGKLVVRRFSLDKTPDCIYTVQDCGSGSSLPEFDPRENHFRIQLVEK